MGVLLRELDRDGFVVVPSGIRPDAMSALDVLLDAALASPSLRASRDGQGQIVGSRHLIDDAPELCRRALAAVGSLVREVLGDDAGLVRALFFDKPIGSSWALPWHQDRVIAVREGGTSKPGGVPLLDAGDALLSRMLGVRIHLDDADEDNGALRVRPGSHRSSESSEERTLRARRGDVVLMRPLLLHASARARDPRPRRVIHLELAPSSPQPSGRWHTYWPLPTGIA